eukprot:jgi/Botrbrau1/1/Bobra.0022s0001.1
MIWSFESTPELDVGTPVTKYRQFWFCCTTTSFGWVPLELRHRNAPCSEVSARE